MLKYHGIDSERHLYGVAEAEIIFVGGIYIKIKYLEWGI